MYVIILEYNHT